MTIVSNTTPLNYLVLIEADHVLPKLFGGVIVPQQVMSELTDARAPAVVRKWVSTPPRWLTVRDCTSRLACTNGLDAGEADAISICKEISATALLIDEKKGRRIAKAEGITAFGTLAVLELAAEREFIALSPTLGRLLNTTFRVSRSLIEAALARDAARKH